MYTRALEGNLADAAIAWLDGGGVSENDIHHPAYVRMIRCALRLSVRDNTSELLRLINSYDNRPLKERRNFVDIDGRIRQLVQKFWDTTPDTDNVHGG